MRCWKDLEHDMFLNGETAYRSALRTVYDTCCQLEERVRQLETQLAATAPAGELQMFSPPGKAAVWIVDRGNQYLADEWGSHETGCNAGYDTGPVGR